MHQVATVLNILLHLHVLTVQHPSLTCILLVANSTPIVDLDSKLNSLRVKRDNKLLLPTPESPMSTTAKIKYNCNHYNR